MGIISARYFSVTWLLFDSTFIIRYIIIENLVKNNKKN